MVGARDRNGYYRANLAIDGGRKHKPIAHLVAEAFLGPRPEGMHVAHLDGNPRNNCVANLAYVTPQENIDHQAVHGTRARGERCGNSKLSADDVRWIRENYIGKTSDFGAIPLAARFGVSRTTIWAIANGRGWDHVEPTVGANRPDRLERLRQRGKRS